MPLVFHCKALQHYKRNTNGNDTNVSSDDFAVGGEMATVCVRTKRVFRDYSPCEQWLSGMALERTGK